MKYRKKPVVIESFKLKYDKELGKYIGLPIWFKKRILNKECFFTCHGIVIITLEGHHLALNGDYIICGIKGELYPCKPDIFEMTYEKVEL